jgi:YHS domain-containing protein
MNDLIELERLIRERLEGATARRRARRETVRHEMEEHERQSARFAVVASRLMDEAIRPRVLKLASLFPNAHVIEDESIPYLCICSFDRTPEYPATTNLRIGVSADSAMECAVISYNLEILPIFFQFEGHDQLVIPLDAADQRAVASWLDTKLLSFTDTYLRLQVVEQYQQSNVVIDPVCGMQINRADAEATAEYKGKTYYFCVEECRQLFLNDPERYAASRSK